MRLPLFLLTLALANVLAAGCGPCGPVDCPSVTGHDLAQKAVDLATYPDGNPAMCDEANPCVASDRCYLGACIPDRGGCVTDDDCGDDTYCSCDDGKTRARPDLGCAGVCVPWGTGPGGSSDPRCQTPPLSPAALSTPTNRCAFNSYTVDGGTQPVPVGALTTPIVADLDGDGLPEITFMSFTSGFYSRHGKDCSEYFSRTFLFAGMNQSNLAVADLEGKGKPNIIGVDDTGHVVVFDNHGELLATSPQPLQLAFPEMGSSANWGGVAIANLDGVGPPEIVAGAQALRFENGALTVLWDKNDVAPQFGALSVVADLDGDGKPEVITGMQILDGMTGESKTDKKPAFTALQQPYFAPAASRAVAPGAYAAVGDLNGDGNPDLVLVQSLQGAERVAVYDFVHDKTFFGPFQLDGEWGGPPTVADFDGDGVPDFATAGQFHFYVFATKCLGVPKPADCVRSKSNGLLWMKTTQDITSGSTGSSVFDFNGDHIAEVVYRDECWLRVYNGPDGRTLFAVPVTSSTALELPVIADVDSDGHADIVVTSDDYITCAGPNGTAEPPEIDTGTPWTHATTGLLVFTDPMNRWMPSRSVWNQHSYHITNVNDDLTIPTVETPSFGSYRQNVQGSNLDPLKEGDATGSGSRGLLAGQTDCKNVWHLKANVCNRGSVDYAAGVPGTFYKSDPRMDNTHPICTGLTAKAIAPGECAEVDCDWLTPDLGADPEFQAIDLWFRADDPGMTLPASATAKECKPDNDVLALKNAFCGIQM